MVIYKFNFLHHWRIKIDCCFGGGDFKPAQRLHTVTLRYAGKKRESNANRELYVAVVACVYWRMVALCTFGIILCTVLSCSINAVIHYVAIKVICYKKKIIFKYKTKRLNVFFKYIFSTNSYNLNVGIPNYLLSKFLIKSFSINIVFIWVIMGVQKLMFDTASAAFIG